MNGISRWKKRKQKKQQKRDDLAKQMWAINPILKVQLYQDEKIWEDYSHGDMNDQKIIEHLRRRKNFDIEMINLMTKYDVDKPPEPQTPSEGAKTSKEQTPPGR